MPGTPAACPSGSSIYSIDHDDATIGFLPGGFCVTTSLENTGTTPITVTGTPNGAGIGDVDNIVVDGGRINYSSTDGGNLNATYDFCSPVTNPYVFIGDLETFTTINFFDASNNPVNINLMNGQSRFAVSGNSALITGTTSTNQDGYVQVPGTYSTLIININNPAPFTLDVIQISVGVCMPDPPAGMMTCPYDLLLWKKDNYCVPVYRDANGVVYEKDQNNNDIASLGDELFVNTPLCGTLELLEANCAIDDNNCTPDFLCDAVPVAVEYYEPMGTGCLYSTYWYDQTSFPINDDDPGNQWSAIFSGTDAFGLPAHPGTPTNTAENCGLDWLGDNEGTIDFDDEAGGANEDEQLQMDGWLYVASHIECIQFRVGSSATDHSVGFYAGTDLNNMTLVAEENDEQAGGSNNSNGVVGSYCIPSSVSTTRDQCGWKILRVRIYAHDDDTAYDPAIDWSFNGGLTWDVVEEQWFVAATSADDNTPPTGVSMGGGGCNPVPTTQVDSDNVLADLAGKLWQIPNNCNSAPTNLYEPNIPNGNNAEEGDHLSLIPYCIVYNDDVAIDCEPCAIDLEVEGCACSNPENIFASDCIQSVSSYKQTLYINSEINTSYTITQSSGISGLAGPFMTAGTSETYTFFVTPGTPYSITVMGDQSMTSQTFEGLCSAPDDCNCPLQPEICGDGLDNDCDGDVDEADSDIVGNCTLDCGPGLTAVEIQGREMVLDGHMTHQVWSRECGNTGCCPSSINPHSCALTAFTCTDVNGLPQHNSACGPADPCAPMGGPQGAAGCTGNDVFTLLGSTHRQAPQFYSTAPEQTQLDGWLVLPPGITCFALKVNHPKAWDAQAIYMGAGIASMNFVGASSFPPAENYSDAVDCQNDTNNNPNITGEDFQYDISSGATPVTVAGCTWNVIRVRAYIFDESWYHNTPVLWNIGNGFEVIPSRYLQSVGVDGWDTDNNKPSASDVIETAPFCAYQDADGDLFLQNGDFYTLNERKCEQVVSNDCLNCPPSLYACVEDDGSCIIPVVVDGTPVQEVPECVFEVFQITPRIITPAMGAGLTTIYWDHDQANCVSSQIINESVFCAFNGYSESPATCPGCLPQHPDYGNATGTLTLSTLGVNGTDLPDDIDNDNFEITALNRRSGENAQQDGWLLVPEGIECIEFRIASPQWDAGALYLGTSINNMTLVGENVNANGNNPVDTFYYEIPAGAPTVDCAPCVNPLEYLRVRTYHHDNNMGANTVWEWNLGNGFVNVPTSHLFPAADQCDDTPPGACPSISDGTPFLAVQDDNGRWFDYASIPNVYQNPFDLTDQVFIEPCSLIEPVCGTALSSLDTRGICSVCIIPGLAKTITSCVPASSGIAGNADVTFKFTLANHGGAEMNNLEINDDLNAIGGYVGIVSGPVVTMTSAGGTAPAPNASYNGSGNLLDGMSGSLNDSEQIMVEIVVEIDPTNTPTNQTNSATGGGTPPNGSPVLLDDSDNGTDPIANDDPADMDDPTPVQLPKINLAKQITDVRPAGAPDRFYIDFSLHVKNTGNVTLNNVVIEDDLASQLGASFIGVTTPPVEDPGFNGDTDIDIPVGSLMPNETDWVMFTIEVQLPVTGSNQATATGEGIGPGGMTTLVSDDSDAGSDPEGNNPGFPGGGPGNNDPTFFGPGVGPGSGGPQSLSCPARINVTLDQNCNAFLPANFGGTTPNGALIAVEIYVDGVYVGNMLNDSHLGREIIYRFIDLSTGQMCWGDINLEDKNIPQVQTSTIEVMCSQPLPNFIKLKDVAKAANGACGVPVTDITEYITVEGEACSGFRTIRKVIGQVDIDGAKSTIDLRIDTIIETPLDTSMVECPLGGPSQQDGLKIPCEDIDDAYPSPDVVFDYYKTLFLKSGYKDAAATSKAVERAYPYVSKGIVQDSVIDRIEPDTVFTPVDTMILINGLWVNTQYIRKDITFDTFYRDTDYPLNLPLPKGVTCNLTVKCTDMQFAGCAGDSSKIMRTWNILDWCNGSIKECMQWIIVEPEPAFFTKVLGKKVTKNSNGTIDFYTMYPDGVVPVEIAPWTCAGELPLTAMVDYSCAPGVDISWSSSAGVVGPDDVLRELWLGEDATVTATATTDCGSHGMFVSFTFTVRPVDRLLPVPIAEDQVILTLAKDGTGTVSEDGGVGKVYVDAIDAGSHNAGCGPVDLCLLLKEELENPIYYLGYPVFVKVEPHKTTFFTGSNAKPEGATQIYHPAGCQVDGTWPGKPATKLDPGRPDYPYVVCKDYVKFCCADLGDNLVALVATNGGGVSAHSWSTVTVEDKSRSSFVCNPGDVLACGKAYDPYSYAPYFATTVCGDLNLEYTIASDIDACGQGQDIITWTLDGQVICTTKIRFDGVSAFNPYEIKWPKHYTGEEISGVIRECELWQGRDANGNFFPVLDSKGNEQYRIVEYSGSVKMGLPFDCAAGDGTGQPVWCEAACALVGSSFEPLEVDAADACQKIIRRWTVIDWCTWDPNTDNQDDENDSEYDQFQAVDDEWLDAYDPSVAGQWLTDYTERDETPPVNYPDGVGIVTKLDCEWCDKQNADADYVYFRYTQVDKDGYYTFDQVIKVIDETDPVVDAPEEVIISIIDGASSKGDDFDDCVANEDVTASVSDMCGDIDVAADGAAWWIEVYVSNADGDRLALAKTKTAFGASATMNSQVGTQGVYHLIVWQVRDGCGNVGEAETLIYFRDDKQPTPICIQDLSTAIMPTSGAVEIWAADYDNGSFDNCSDVEFWFLVDDDGISTDDQETGTYVPNLNVTCEMLAALGGTETITLGLYVSDADDNIDFCNISLNVNGADEVCNLTGNAVSIEGEVATAFGDMVEGVTVALNVGAKVNTASDGQYAFYAPVLAEDYALRAERDDNYLNGVSTLDLVLMQKHILGVSMLDNPYKIIAGDINSDGQLSASDLVELRRLILGLSDGLPNNDSWRFIDATQTFDNALSPFPFEEILHISNITQSMENQDFVGVKIGDVSGDAIANSLLAESRSIRGQLSLEIDDALVKKDEVIEVAVSSSGFEDILGYQYTMELDGFEFIEARSGSIALDASNFGLIDRKTVTTSWYLADRINGSDVLFTLVLRATEDARISKGLSISSRITRAEAYTVSGDLYDVSFVFDQTDESGKSSAFELLQNTPNPFSEFTTIGFELGSSGMTTLTVFDVTGKVVLVQNREYKAGYHEVILRKVDLGDSGVLYYQLESDAYTATRKMILIK